MKTFALAIAALGICMSGSAFARSPDYYEVPRIEVPYSDLDLRSPAGAEAMLNRIRWAAAQVCGDRPDIRDVHFGADFRSCEAKAVRNAVRSLNVAMVSELYFGSATAVRMTSVTQR